MRTELLPEIVDDLKKKSGVSFPWQLQISLKGENTPTRLWDRGTSSCDELGPLPFGDNATDERGGKGIRKLGIPTVVDHLMQQAMHQVLSPVFDPFFSDHCYGFRHGRSANQAVFRAREYVSGGAVGSGIWIWKSSSTM